MINTLLLGSMEFGKYIYSNSNELDLNIFTHKDKDISKVLNSSFILENGNQFNYKLMVRTQIPLNFYHSNFYVTLF